MGSMSVPTYLLVDGENIDATLGMSVLGRRPEPEERPRWDRVLAYCDELSSADATEGEGNEARALFFLNATSGHMPMSFIQALLAGLTSTDTPPARHGRPEPGSRPRPHARVTPRSHSDQVGKRLISLGPLRASPEAVGHRDR